MKQAGLISRVDVATKWRMHMVVVLKTDGTTRIFMDLARLNLSVQRECHPIPLVYFTSTKTLHILPHLLVPLEGSVLTDCRLASLYLLNIFQKQMSEILSGLEDIVSMMDDVLVYGKCQEEHDQKLTVVLERLQEAKVSLNKK